MSILKPKPQNIPAMPLRPDTMVEHYKIGKVIGVGGFSVVYSALDTKTNTVVAIKEFYATNCMRRARDASLHVFPKDQEHKYHIGLKRFFDEGLTLSQIDHPNIVNVSNFFRCNNTAYLVMRFEHGKDLRWFIKNTEYVPDEEFILSVFSMVLAGLKEVHKNHFLHLDIKPSNILLRASGVPLILDLGAAYKFPQKERHKVHTLTHGYSAPEQHEKQNLDLCSDLYAIAMTMRACITHKSPPSAVKRLKKDTLRPLRETHGKHYRKNLILAIDKASQLEPSLRPQSVDEFVEIMTTR
ncbi:serine/threonine protein kinase [Arenicella xantha]|uniref:Serine/threonine protein kinase n=1 Tax=Arenicella xantha TaxID=644221 RepID=A0A395JGJ6_9GAMM|nr:serine/threonine-protein kinase [Arenicella xantha]RBP48912.1 serine/threonine protein kinase [Arenicella xantha]